MQEELRTLPACFIDKIKYLLELITVNCRQQHKNIGISF